MSPAAALTLPGQVHALLAAVGARNLAAAQQAGALGRPVTFAQRRTAERVARADALRGRALELCAARDTSIADLLAATPGSSPAQWPWVLKTLVDAGLVERLPRTAAALRYRTTPSGRAALAQLLSSPGDH